MLTTTQNYVTYQGNGATTSFPFGFIVPAAGQLVVSITNNNVSPAVTTVLSASQYSVTGIGTGNEFAGGSGSGGVLTYPTSGNPLPAGWSITIQRIVPYLQGISLTNQGAFYPQVVEAALDYLTMAVQQIAAGTSGTSPVLPAWISGLQTLTDVNNNVNSATPSLAGLAPVYKTANTAATTMTGFTNLVAGHYFKVIFEDANTTVSFGTGIIGNSSQSWSPNLGDFMDCVTDGTCVYAFTSGTLSTLQSYINTEVAAQIAPLQVSFRNRLINGDMGIDRRHMGSPQSVQQSDSGDNLYRLDRWAVAITGAGITAQQVSGSGQWKNALQLSGAASNTGFSVYQRIESINTVDLAGSTVTLEIDLASSSLTTITWTAYYPNAQDNWSGQTQVATGTFTINGNLSRYSTTITLGTAGGKTAANGLSIVFSGGGLGASQTFQITGAQLESGTAATTYERIPDDIQLLRCLRYCPSWSSTAGVVAPAFTTGTTGGYAVFSFSVPARIAPTGLSTTTTVTLVASGGASSTVTPGLGAWSDACVLIALSGGSGLTANQPGYINATAGSLYLMGCEL
jgi:hypothetical protein